MKVLLHDPADLPALIERVHDEKNAKQRDRYRVVLIAAQGLEGQEQRRDQIAAAVGRSRQFVDEWVKRYRHGGLSALRAKKQPGGTPRLTAAQKQELRQLLDAGPQEGVDPRSSFFGEDIRQLIHRHFGKLYSLSGTYKLLHGLGYSWLCPRPRHPQGDPVAAEAFKKRGSSRSRRCGRSIPASGS